MKTDARCLFFDKSKVFTKAEDRAYLRERLLVSVTEKLLVIMEEKDVSKTALARKLGKSRSYVTQILSGARNMTLGTFSDICFALDAEPKVLIRSSDELSQPELDPQLIANEWRTVTEEIEKLFAAIGSPNNEKAPVPRGSWAVKGCNDDVYHIEMTSGRQHDIASCTAAFG